MPTPTAILFGNSGGKDSALGGISCANGLMRTPRASFCPAAPSGILPSTRTTDGGGRQFGIKTRVIDLTAQKELAIETMSQVATLSQAAIGNLAPRLRMLTLYAIGASENRLVAGTATPVSTTWATLPSGGMGPMTSTPSRT